MSTVELIGRAEALAQDARAADAVQLLTEANRAQPDPEFEVALVRLRHAAVADPVPPVEHDEVWPPPVDDPFDRPGIPQIVAADLDVKTLNAALQHRGSLLVRGLLESDVAASLFEEVKRAEAARQANRDGATVEETTPWFVPFEADERYSFGTWERMFTGYTGGVLSVDAPRALFHVIDALKGAGIDGLLAEYFGEPATLSAKKSTLRKATPESRSDWHQDGAFLGPSTRTVNTWVALTPCGAQAPGIDVFGIPFDGIVPTGTDDAIFDWSVSPEQAERIGMRYVERPDFGAGDALLFNQMTLHRTAVDAATMTGERYAIESWFFAASTYPYEQVPILF